MKLFLLAASLLATSFTECHAFPGRAILYKMTIDVVNLLEEGCITDIWLGAHEGAFVASEGRLRSIVDAFAESSEGADGVSAGPLCPGEETTIEFVVNVQKTQLPYYLSFAATTDAGFLANSNAEEYPIFERAKRGLDPDIIVTADDGSNIMSMSVASEFLRPSRKNIVVGAGRVIPITKTRANGSAFLRVFADGSKLFYAIATRDYQNADFVACSLHRGDRRENGPELVELFNFNTMQPFGTDQRVPTRLRPGTQRGFIEQGSFDKRNEEVWLDILNKEVYIVCTSESFPDGEIRGNP